MFAPRLESSKIQRDDVCADGDRHQPHRHYHHHHRHNNNNSNRIVNRTVYGTVNNHNNNKNNNNNQTTLHNTRLYSRIVGDAAAEIGEAPTPSTVLIAAAAAAAPRIYPAVERGAAVRTLGVVEPSPPSPVGVGVVAPAVLSLSYTTTERRCSNVRRTGGETESAGRFLRVGGRLVCCCTHRQ